MIVEKCSNGYIVTRGAGKTVHETLDEVFSNLLQHFEGRAETSRGEAHGRVIIVRGPLRPEPFKQGCGICGSGLVFIRGRYPAEDRREVCPTCAVERLENIKEIAESNLTGQSQCDKGEI